MLTTVHTMLTNHRRFTYLLMCGKFLDKTEIPISLESQQDRDLDFHLTKFSCHLSGLSCYVGLEIPEPLILKLHAWGEGRGVATKVAL